MLEEGGGLELRAAELVEAVPEPVAHEREREGAVLDGPHAAAVVAIRIVRRVLGRERADAPAGPEVGLKEALDDALGALLRDDGRGEAVERVRGDRPDALSVGVETEGVEPFVLHPERLVEPLLED